MSIPSSTLIESTINALQAHLSSLAKEKASIEDKIADVNESIRQWRSALRGLENNHSSKDSASRKKRGDNPRIVHEWFISHPGQLFTIPEVAAGTGLQNGSVHNVLNKKNSEYEKDAIGKWKLRSPVSEVIKNGAVAIGE